jgi:hypothetical protein
VHLLRRLHPAEKDNLGRSERGKDGTSLDPSSGVEQGIPELAGAIGETGKHTSHLVKGL